MASSATSVRRQADKQPPSVGRVMLIAGTILLVMLALTLPRSSANIAMFYLQDQDWPIILVAGLLLFMARSAAAAAGRAAVPSLVPRRRAAAALFMALAALLVLLTQLITGNLPLSRDELMVLFDMAVFADGRLATPLAAEWRSYALGLVPDFLINQDSPTALVSAYLPMNALLRLGVSSVVPAALMNPILWALGGVALADIARRHFGADGRAVLITLLLYALSAQGWVNAMTPYAMTGHLALNLIWLAAFLRGGRWHLLAIAAGFVATGLHQLVFHPLFAAPFLAQRLWRGEWRLALGYAAAYAAICAFWIGYPLAATLATGVAASGAGAQDDFFQDRLLPLLLNRNPATMPLMLLNGLRFFAWQHLALLPLLIAAVPLLRDPKGLALPLFAGLVATVAMAALLLPYQGHGWGYRYLHGFIGSAALLGAMGYCRLRAADASRTDGLVVITTLLTLLAMAWLLLRVHSFMVPHIALERALARTDADIVLVDTEPTLHTDDGRWAASAVDFVRNAPDLSNQPLRLSSQHLGPTAIAALCSRGRIALFTRTEQQAVGLGLNRPAASPVFVAKIARLRSAAAAGRCQLVG